MQVFLPFHSVETSIRVLDKVRLWKQVLEAYQLINCIEKGSGWENHPVTKMYKGYIPFLKFYFNYGLERWKLVGNSSFEKFELKPGEVKLPKWFENQEFHLSHRSNLLRKALDDARGIGAAGLPKRLSTSLLENLASVGITRDNTRIDLPYIWPI